MILNLLWWILLSIFVAYAALMLVYAVGWLRLTESKGDTIDCKARNSKTSIQYTIVCAFRNEAANLPSLVNDLQTQTLAGSSFECIFVNDHSTDSSCSVLQHAIDKAANYNFRLLHSQGEGKKAALMRGVQAAQGKVIITTDADCMPTKHWLQTIGNHYTQHSPTMLVAPVVLLAGKSIWSKIQTVEYFSLLASTAGSIGAGMPLMCSGANLAFERSLYAHNNATQQQQSSGDDMFLLMTAKRLYGNRSIAFCKSADAVVLARPCKSFSEFVQQRLRWASKSPTYPDRQIIAVSILILVVNTASAILWLYALCMPDSAILAYKLLATKAGVDFVLLTLVMRHFGYSRLLWLFAPLQLLYPFYVLGIGFGSFVAKARWKGRTVKT